MSSAATVEQEVEALERLDLEGLRSAWRDRFRTEPVVRSRDLLRRMLAFDIQAAVYGGLDAEVRQQLRKAAVAAPKKATLQAGTTISREWRGEQHVVEVSESGFTHRGNAYASLSEVARAITGARWSGPRFFGVRDSDRLTPR